MIEDGKRTKREEGGQGRGRENTPTSSIVEMNGQSHDGRALYPKSNPSQSRELLFGKILSRMEEQKKRQKQKDEKADSRHQAYDQLAQKLMEMGCKNRLLRDQMKLQMMKTSVQLQCVQETKHRIGVIAEEIVKLRNTDDPRESHHNTIDFPVRPSKEAEPKKPRREPQIDTNDIEERDGVVVSDGPDSNTQPICHSTTISDMLAAWGLPCGKSDEGMLESLIPLNRRYQYVDAARGLIYQYDEERVRSITAFIEKGVGRAALDLLCTMIKPQEWFRDVHMDLVLNLFRLRLQTMPRVFKSQRIAILDVTFQQLWTSKHKEWTTTRAIVSGAAKFYEGSLPICAIPSQKKRWGDDVDTLYGVLNISGNHWGALVISLTERTVTVYDCVRGNREENSKLAVVFAEMVPHLMFVMDPAGYPVNRPYTVTVLDPSDGIPEMTFPFGDCGVFALKFLECLMMDVPFGPNHLSTANMRGFREKYAADIYAEIPR